MNVLYSVSPVQASTNTNVLVTGSTLSSGRAWALSYTIENSGDDSIDYEVIGGSLQDLSDGTVVQASATLASGAFGSYAVSTPPYRFYGIKIVSTVNDTPGEATVRGIVKG